MAWMLQGLEAAFIHSITILSAESDDFSVVANEHDGLIVRQEADDEVTFSQALRRGMEVARHMSGFYRAQLVEKPHADEDDVVEMYGREEQGESVQERNHSTNRRNEPSDEQNRHAYQRAPKGRAGDEIPRRDEGPGLSQHMRGSQVPSENAICQESRRATTWQAQYSSPQYEKDP